MNEDKRLAFIGLGKMGAGMAHTLLRAGYDLTVFNRTSAKAAALVVEGARGAVSAAAAADGQHTVVLSLADEAAVEQVLFEELVAVLRPGCTVIDTSTVSPAYAVSAAERLRARGIRRVEAVVVGNPLQARGGELRVYTAGAEADVTPVARVLDALAMEVTHVGPAGAAATLKLALNLLLGAQIAALSEAVRYGTAAGLDRDTLLATIAGTGFSSQVMRFRSELMRQRRYEPAFFRARLMEKDLRLALDHTPDAVSTMPVLDAVRAAFRGVLAAGDGDKDAAVLIEHAGEPAGAAATAG
ncbi:NAD(P)-dependent oxidoreductase [Nocardia sp. CDC153]|uniref:NAD(P)-dependent oxidoreductase n=1 Tax=Nocardia sp. CDC153 TaxID=3112167 RepID=UPI002DB5D541|nr:NAD(P)-dependent oxidoreductase [Nocardia sp. CDC153]MEC3952013.1 NAD(P)-dependent oxidoreductase [Nocardia sp. CDC153]